LIREDKMVLYSGLRKKSGIIGFLAFSVALAVLAMSGCVSSKVSIDVPFGASAESAGVTMSTAKTGEGEFQVTLSSAAPEELTLHLRMSYPEIGFDYGDSHGNEYDDNKFNARYEIGNTAGTLRTGEKRDITVKLANMHEVNRSFDFTARVSLIGDTGRTDFRVSIADRDLFADVEYLRSMNKTDYWNPHQIGVNREKYLRHVEDL
jgi:hypothetical protein